MKRAVITGVTSMIGFSLVQECIKEKVEVLGIIRKNSVKKERLAGCPGVRLIECELEELNRLPGLISGTCDTFYHIAWGNTGKNRNKSTELQSQNIKYTLEAVKAAKALGCRRFVGAGSQAEYGPVQADVIHPDTPVNPNTPYGASKLAACQLSAMLCKELEIEHIWPRIFSVYGIYEKETAMVASSLRKMLKGLPAEFTPACQRWDYLYSKDAGRAFYLLGCKGIPGRIYCVGSGKARPLKEYIEIMTMLTNAKDVRIGAKPYSSEGVMNLCADTKSLTEDTGFVPAYTFEEGIRETIAWIEEEEYGKKKDIGSNTNL